MRNVPIDRRGRIKIIRVNSAEAKTNRTANEARGHLAKEFDAKAKSREGIARLKGELSLESSKSKWPAANRITSRVMKVINASNRTEKYNKGIQAETRAKQAVESDEVDKKGKQEAVTARTSRPRKDRGASRRQSGGE